jgi:hypothetical protein
MQFLTSVFVKFSDNATDYCYLVPPSIKDIKIGDYVVVPTTCYYGIPYRVGRVVDVMCKREKDYSQHLNYVVAKVDDDDYKESQAAKEKNNEFTAIMNSLCEYGKKYDVDLWANSEMDYSVNGMTVTITLIDFGKYKPAFFYEPQFGKKD